MGKSSQIKLSAYTFTLFISFFGLAFCLYLIVDNPLEGIREQLTPTVLAKTFEFQQQINSPTNMESQKTLNLSRLLNLQPQGDAAVMTSSSQLHEKDKIYRKNCAGSKLVAEKDCRMDDVACSKGIGIFIESVQRKRHFHIFFR